MTLPPCSSQRPLVLLISHGKPGMSPFSSSSHAAAAVTPGNCTPTDPTNQPPDAPALPDCSSNKCPDHEELVLYNEDTEHQIPGYGSYSSTPEPVSCSDKPGLKNLYGVGDPLPDPPIRTGNTVLDKPSPSTPEHPDHPVPLLCTVNEDPEHPTPDDGGGSHSSRPEPVPGHDNPELKPSLHEIVKHPLPDPPLLREQSSDENPPMLMLCGHAVSNQSLMKLSRSSSRTFKCSYCPLEAVASQCKQLHF